MADREWFVNGVQILETGTEEYFVHGVQVNEDQAAGFNAQRQAIIDGLDGDLATGTSWDTVRAGIAVTDVARTSPTVVTITLPALGSYDITATETITATIPAAALTGAVQIIASPTFTVDAVASGLSIPVAMHHYTKNIGAI